MFSNHRGGPVWDSDVFLKSVTYRPTLSKFREGPVKKTPGSISWSILAKQCYLLSLSETFSFDGKLFHFQPPSPPSVFGQGRTLRWCVSPAAGYCPLIRGSAILSLYCMPRISPVFVICGNVFLHAQHLHLLSISRKPMFVEKSNFATRGFPVRQFTTGSKHHLFSPNIGEIV